MFDYRYAAAFLETAKTKSISLAAANLNVSQSAISRQLLLLEQALGYEIFFRRSRGVELTPLGLALYERIDEFDAWAKGGSDSHSLPVRIGALEGVFNSWLTTKIINSFEANIPAKLTLRHLGNLEIQMALEKGEIDIGISSSKIDSERVSSEKLFSEEICIISSNKIDAKSIEKYCWIGFSHMQYLKKLAKNKESQRYIKAASLELVIKLVRAKMGIAALPSHLVHDKEGLILTPTSLRATIYLHLPSYRQVPHHIQYFIDSVIFSK